MTQKYTPEQIAENRAKWLAALRSGEFEQAQGVLCRQDEDGKRSYCCLGVAEAVRGAEFAESPLGSLSIAWTNEGGQTLYENGVLTPEGAAWLGLPRIPQLAVDYEYEGEDGESFSYTHLTELNDEANLTFRQIADLIEKNGLSDQ